MVELYFCIASQSQKFFKRVYYLKQINFIMGGPLQRGSRGNFSRFPLNPPLPADQIWAEKPFHPAAKEFCQKWKNYIFTKICDLVECNVSRNNHITYDVQPSHCWVMASVQARTHGGMQGMHPPHLKRVLHETWFHWKSSPKIFLYCTLLNRQRY